MTSKCVNTGKFYTFIAQSCNSTQFVEITGQYHVRNQRFYEFYAHIMAKTKIDLPLKFHADEITNTQI